MADRKGEENDQVRRGRRNGPRSSAPLESASSMTAFLHRYPVRSGHNSSTVGRSLAGQESLTLSSGTSQTTAAGSKSIHNNRNNNAQSDAGRGDSRLTKAAEDAAVPQDQHCAGEIETIVETGGNNGKTRPCCGRRRVAEKVLDRGDDRPWVDDYVNASLLGRFVFSWCSRLENETLRRELDTSDLWTTLPSQKCEVITERVRKTWNVELELLLSEKTKDERKESACRRRGRSSSSAAKEKKKPSLARAIFYAFAPEIRRVALFKSLWLVAILLSNALFFNSTLRVLQEFSSGSGSQPVVYAGTMAIPYIGFFWAFAFGFSDVCRSLFINAHWWNASIAGLKARIAVSNLVFEKLTKLRQVESVGGVVTHTTNDAQRIMDALTYGIFVVSTPTAMIAIVIIGSFYLSAAFAIGLAILILFLPIQVRIGGLSQRIHRQTVKISSERVTLMSEILRAIKLVKLYGWGRSFSAKVNAVRGQELTNLKRGAKVRATNQSISFTTPTLVVACAFAFHTLVLGEPLLAAEAFTTVALLNAARFPLSILPQATRCLSEAMVACRRLEKFLMSGNIHELGSPAREVTAFSSSSSSQDKTGGASSSMTTTTVPADGAIHPYRSEKEDARNGSANSVDDDDDDDDEASSYAIVMRNCEFTWWKDGDTPQTIADRPAHLRVPCLRIPKNKITLVVGKLGSGKTSLLAGAILGEMIRKKSSSSSLAPSQYYVPSSARMAYGAQNPFIFNATVRENILMNSKEDPKRLEQVIEACALEPDLRQFPAGLETELGERGINGSGGQKARIALARALYAGADVLILDDVLSAVDAHVRQHLWRAIRFGSLLENKTIIMATHCGEILHEADYLVKCEGGLVDDVVTFKELTSSVVDGDDKQRPRMRLDEFLCAVGCTLEPVSAGDGDGDNDRDVQDQEEEKTPAQVPAGSGTEEKSDEDVEDGLEETTAGGNDNAKPSSSSPQATVEVNRDSSPKSSDRQHDGKLIQKETRATGNVKLRTVKKMLFRPGSVWFSVVSILVLIANEASIALGTGLWITAWTQDVFNQTDSFYSGILFAIMGGILLLSEIRGILFSHMMLHAARGVHDDAFQTLMQAKLSFFDVTPMGRVLSRFSGDVDVMDVLLPEVVETSFSLLIRSLFSFIMIAIVFVWFLIPMAVLMAVFVSFFLRFRPSLRMMKRIDATARSPILSLVESTASGLTTLRAFGQLETTRKRAMADFDVLFKTALAFNATSRYMAVRLDMITSASTVTTACFCVLFASQASPGLAGLALTSVLQTGGVFQFAIRQLMEAESMFASVERLVQFTDTVPKEEDVTTEAVMMTSSTSKGAWPSEGEIVFDRVYARYRSRLPFVLKGLSFRVPGKSSCGLVGRTGSGKSSCLLALFRIFKVYQGSIRIDGRDVATVPLDELRSRVLSIIPQDPSLFKGTMRSNLDPFNEHSDAELRFALDKVHLANVGSLDLSVDEAGGNLSHGERQLFCLARALLRKTPIVCLDEATSSIDSSTSKVIGETIKELFRDRTLLVVAHRLDVVASLDQVCVLEAGKCVEQGDPRKLIAKGSGPFFDLWTKHQNASITAAASINAA